MRIPDFIKDCVVYLCTCDKSADDEEIYTPRCTAFFLDFRADGDPVGFQYLITAWHSIIEAGERKLFVRANTKKCKHAIYHLPETFKWVTRPVTEGKVIDVAIASCPVPEDSTVIPVPLGALMFDPSITGTGIRGSEIGVGDEVFITGLFGRKKGDNKNLPIVRAGTIAMMPEDGEPIRNVEIGRGSGIKGDMDAVLIEARSISGISGSPVFVRPTVSCELNLMTPDGAKPVRLSGIGGWIFLLGLVHGHWDIKPQDKNDVDPPRPMIEDEQVNTGIAIVVPAISITQVLFSEELRAMREEATKKHKEKESVPPTHDSLFDEEHQGLSKQGFNEALKKVSRKLSDEESSQPGEGKTET